MAREIEPQYTNSPQVRDQVLEYVMAEGAAFDLEIAVATNNCPKEIDDELKSLIEEGLVEGRKSHYGLPGLIYVGTKKAFKIHGKLDG